MNSSLIWSFSNIETYSSNCSICVLPVAVVTVLWSAVVATYVIFLEIGFAYGVHTRYTAVSPEFNQFEQITVTHSHM